MVPELLTIPEAAEALRLSESSMKRILRQSLVPTVRFPSYRGKGERAARADPEDIRDSIARCTQENGLGKDGHGTRSATDPQP